MTKQTAVPPAEEAERLARVAAIRAQIADGTYETPEKLSAAIDAFLASAGDAEPRAQGQPAPRRPR